MDFAELQKRKRPNTARCDICLDPDAVDAYVAAREARDEALAASLSDVEDEAARADLSAARDALLAAESVLESNVVTFHFRALPGVEYEELLDAHPPTPDQLRTARQRNRMLVYNSDSFPQALVAACSEDPHLDPSDVAQIWKDPNWSYEERMVLFNTATQANSSRRVPDLGKGSGPTRN